MRPYEVLGARRWRLERHVCVRLTPATIGALCLLLLLVLRLVTRDGHWVLFSVMWAWAGIAQVGKARRLRSRIQSAADTSFGQVDHEADEGGGFPDGVGQVGWTER